jgi:3-hydroxyisobutyryl-CoA hydrolase
VLRDRIRGRPTWSPASLTDVSDLDIENKFFTANAESPQLVVPEFVLDRTPQHPMLFALPTEDDIMSVVKGTHRTSSSTALTVDELLDRFDTLTRFKMGAREKVRRTIDRKCNVDKDGYVTWR